MKDKKKIKVVDVSDLEIIASKQVGDASLKSVEENIADTEMENEIDQNNPKTARDKKNKRKRIKLKKDKKNEQSYWEFILFLGVVMFVVSSTIFLAFFLIKNLSIKDSGKISIKNISSDSIPELQPNSGNKKEDVSVDNQIKIEPENDPKLITIKILNGGAPAGSAAKAKEVLVAKGYKKIEAGNAQKSDYKGVTIFYAAELKTAAEKTQVDLKAKYPTVQIKAAGSGDEASSSIVIILGK